LIRIGERRTFHPCLAEAATPEAERSAAMDADLDRTRLPWVDQISAAFPHHGFTDFHRRALPDLVARNGRLIARDLHDAPPLAFQTPRGAGYCWRPTLEGVAVDEGVDGAATVVEISEEAFSDYVNELLSAVGATRTGRARFIKGDIKGWRRWEPAIRSLVNNKPIYDAAAAETLIDRSGRPLRLDRAFRAEEPLDEMAHYLATMGYLHIRGVFGTDEIAVLRDEVERCREGSTPGDPHSWWSLNSKGEELITRINHCERFSRTILDLAHDPRLSRYARLAGPHLRVCDDRLDGPMVFIKHADVVRGNGDLWWHIDDGIGGSPVMNPLIQAGVQLDRADAGNGQLLLMAGSHRYNKHSVDWGAEGDLPVVALETEPGDLTVHFGDTMHSTPPPTSADAGRRVLYYKFAEPKTFAWIPEHCHYNDVLFTVDEAGQVAARAETWRGASY
jgi:hypothetical protein